jgi:GNAT superfamily N-acetyltransferase
MVTRAGRPGDADAVGRVLHEAFSDVAVRHGYASDFPSVQYGVGLARTLLSAPPYRGVVAQRGREIVGAAFVNVADPIRGIGPVGVLPRAQGSGAGRALMEAVIEEGSGGAGLRLTQDLFNMTSLSLYASLGFELKEPLALFQGRPPAPPPGAAPAHVRAMADHDLAACSALCRRVHGEPRDAEVAAALRGGLPAVVAERGERLVAYTTTLSWWQRGHAVAESRADLRALLSGAGALAHEPLTFLVPLRDAELHQWCLAGGLRTVKPMALMALGPYLEPRGAWLPSVAY